MVYEKRNNRSSKGWWRNFFLIFSGRVILSFFVSLSFFMSLNVILLKEGEDKIFCVGLLFHITQSDSEESYFFVILTLSRSPEPKPWAEALSRSPELMRRVSEGSAKGQRRVSEGSAKGLRRGRISSLIFRLCPIMQKTLYIDEKTFLAKSTNFC